MFSSSHKRTIATLLIMLTSMAMVESYYSGSSRIQSIDSSGESSVRQEILDIIEKTPGIFFRSTIRATNRTVGVIQYHLKWLTDNGRIVSFEINNYKGYFLSSYARISDKKKKALIMLRIAQKKEIMEYLIQKKTVSQQELTKELNMTDQTLSYHLKVLENMDLIIRKRNGMGKYIALDEEIYDYLRSYNNLLFISQ